MRADRDAFCWRSLGYGWIGLTTIAGAGAIPALVLLGIGQASTVLASTLLLGQEAPQHIRGSVFGLQSFFGAWGSSRYRPAAAPDDAEGPGSPFLLIATLNLLVLVWAWRVKRLPAAPSGAAVASTTTAAPAPPVLPP